MKSCCLDFFLHHSFMAFVTHEAFPGMFSGISQQFCPGGKHLLKQDTLPVIIAVCHFLALLPTLWDDS